MNAEFCEHLETIYAKFDSLFSLDNGWAGADTLDFDVEKFKFSWVKLFIPTDNRFSISIVNEDNCVVFYRDSETSKKIKIFSRDPWDTNQQKNVLYISGEYNEDFLKFAEEFFLFIKNKINQNCRNRNELGKFVKKGN